MTDKTVSAAMGLAVLIAPAAALGAGEAYEIDTAHTYVGFSVERFGFNDVVASFPGVSGTVMLDEAAPQMSSVEAAIDVASIVSGDATRNDHLLGPFWFNAEEFAAITFRSTSVELTGEKAAHVVGDLTVLGQTRPVTLNVTLNKLGADPATKRQAAGFSVTASLQRSGFGMNTAAALIGDDVSVRIEALAHKVEE